MRMLESVHIYSRTDIPMIKQGRKSSRDQVTIGNDVWIGDDVLVVGSRNIGTGSVIAARTVLVKSFPDYSVIGGNPSQLIKSRLN